ncbi:DUF445 family protein [Pseudonocardia sp. TRM90224]|uniref:DUF445 family protein n=1 Tax=Pseudonocardia sp. TRM90224 TaxID=2812678 RepID=UPI001E5ABC0B|nr:DUF445 family protein [Pseudonocardia sp. TRM90224]
MEEILRNVGEYWYVYASMPLLAALIGYVTKILAIEMMFKPLEFVGKPPFLGWQGIVPRRAARMASIACDTMTTKLISPSEIFGRLDADRVAKEIEKPLLDNIEDITRHVATQFQPGLWESMPETVRSLVIARVQRQAPKIVQNIMAAVKDDIDSVFDLKDMIVTNLVRDKALLNRIFREAGDEEFAFIRRSGIYFGAAIGVIQAVAWAVFRSPLIMPLFGLVTGWFTDWLALKMIFNPKQPKRYLGFFEWQGLFLKRRREVAAAYGALIAKEIITPHNIIQAVLRGPTSDKLYAMVQKEVQSVLDAQTGIVRPIVVFAVGSTRYQEMKRAVSTQVMEALPETMLYVEDYAEDAMDIRNTLVTKMQELTTEEFEELLRPAFEQDEWILIAVGATLGFLVGELQLLLVESLTH